MKLRKVTVTYSLDSLSNGSCKYACDMPSFEKYFPTEISKYFVNLWGVGVNWASLINSNLKIATDSLPFCLSTWTMGAAQWKNCTGEMIPMLSSFSNSVSTFSFNARGTEWALKNLGVALLSTFRFSSIPCRQPSSLQNSEEYFSSSSCRDLTFDKTLEFFISNSNHFGLWLGRYWGHSPIPLPS